jgi:hypothetical protein
MSGDCNDAVASIRPGEGTCGVDTAMLLVCQGDGTYVETACGAGTRCVLQPDGSGECR